jgi:hypothetical protein
MTVAAVRADRTPTTSLDRRALLGFFAISYAISWVWMLPIVVGGDTVDQGRGWPTHVPAAAHL